MSKRRTAPKQSPAPTSDYRLGRAILGWQNQLLEPKKDTVPFEKQQINPIVFLMFTHPDIAWRIFPRDLKKAERLLTLFDETLTQLNQKGIYAVDKMVRLLRRNGEYRLGEDTANLLATFMQETRRRQHTEGRRLLLRHIARLKGTEVGSFKDEDEPDAIIDLGKEGPRPIADLLPPFDPPFDLPPH